MEAERELKSLEEVQACTFTPFLENKYQSDANLIKSYASEKLSLPSHLLESISKEGRNQVVNQKASVKLASQKGVIEHLQR